MAKKKKNPPTVEDVMNECRQKVKQGLGGKKLTKAASDYWETNHYTAIKKMIDGGANWDTDKKNVLPVAKKLGKVAKALTDKGKVLLWAAEAAHVAVKADPRCPPIGAGGYCDF